MGGASRSTGTKDRTRALEALLQQINSGILFHQRSDLSSFVNWKANAESPIHRWLRYREAYSPHLITKLSLVDDILDPFCGCGSILIGAAERGYKSTGIDFNPLAVFATTVKLRALSRRQIAAIGSFVDNLRSADDLDEPWSIPALSIARKVFEPSILDTLLRIRSRLESEFCVDREARDFALLAWVSILEKVGSYFKEGNGIKYRNRKRLKTGYVSRLEGKWQNQRFGPDQKKFVIESFCSHLRMMLQDTKYWRKGRWRDQTVIEGNVLEMDQLLPQKKFNSIVFSPHMRTDSTTLNP